MRRRCRRPIRPEMCCVGSPIFGNGFRRDGNLLPRAALIVASREQAMNEQNSAAQAPEPRKGMPSPRLDETEFKRRYRQHFDDPAFAPLRSEIERIATVAWDAYSDSRTSPVTTKAGQEFADPDYDISVEWLAARRAVLEAQARYEDKNLPPRVLLINGSSRSERRIGRPAATSR